MTDVAVAGIQLPSRTWGFEADVSCYATAVLCNALGRYRSAMEAAQTFLADANGRWTPALPELVEAAVRCEEPDLARRAVDQLAITTSPSGTNWAVGIECLFRALIADDSGAEPLFVESVDRLGRTRIVTSSARAQLLYGEWLRRQGRRVDAPLLRHRIPEVDTTAPTPQVLDIPGPASASQGLRRTKLTQCATIIDKIFA